MFAIRKNIPYQVKILMFFMKRRSRDSFLHDGVLILLYFRSMRDFNASSELYYKRVHREDAWVNTVFFSIYATLVRNKLQNCRIRRICKDFGVASISVGLRVELLNDHPRASWN